MAEAPRSNSARSCNGRSSFANCQSCWTAFALSRERLPLRRTSGRAAPREKSRGTAPVSQQYQTTLQREVTFEGVGLHTGGRARVSLMPAVQGSGLTIRSGENPFRALTSDLVAETVRATTITVGDRTISTVEHLLSAILGMGLDNAAITVEGDEIPVMDGSAKLFAEAIAQAGLVAQSAPRRRFVAIAPCYYRDGDRLLIVLPASSFRVRFTVDFEQPVGSQYFAGEITPETYLREIAPARTFGWLHEVEGLLARGLARGGSLDNAVVYDENGPVNELRFESEAVRHKVLDLIGDFALLGAYPQCEIVSFKSGHRLHALAVADLRRALTSGDTAVAYP
ncbi:UDP-3-O-[3-hydroxymyristoyl] N-acetylglucosamine deacetylase [bacterium]|nr:MAG: UDP-3-O-[3-hydroxymyristoyl] N-acetylglucosamine deacetylase [bacterium]